MNHQPFPSQSHFISLSKLWPRPYFATVALYIPNVYPLSSEELLIITRSSSPTLFWRREKQKFHKLTVEWIFPFFSLVYAHKNLMPCYLCQWNYFWIHSDSITCSIQRPLFTCSARKPIFHIRPEGLFTILDLQVILLRQGLLEWPSSPLPRQGKRQTPMKFLIVMFLCVMWNMSCAKQY